MTSRIAWHRARREERQWIKSWKIKRKREQFRIILEKEKQENQRECLREEDREF